MRSFYVYDGKGNIVRSIDFLSKKCYNYEYDGGKVVRATECDITLYGEIITGKVVVAVAVIAAVAAPAGGALCAVASTFVGAAKGAVIGAVTGAVTGAATGAVQGAVEGYRETGTLVGTLRGMGKGAAKGAVEGAKDGLLSGMVMGGIGGAMNPSFCFVAGTAVLTVSGKKAIEAIQVGDTIPCVDHITGESAEKKVISTTVNKVDRLIELDINGETIQCTEIHPFQVKGRGWVNASELTPGDIVYTKDWGTATIRSVNLLELDEPVEVFNFEVEDCHTYFVGDGLFLVHNGLCNELGKAGEQTAGITKNTETVNMFGRNRIPDGFANKIYLQEVKIVKTQSYTRQLKDYFMYAKENHMKVELFIRYNDTHLTQPLIDAIYQFGVVLRYI